VLAGGEAKAKSRRWIAVNLEAVGLERVLGRHSQSEAKPLISRAYLQEYGSQAPTCVPMMQLRALLDVDSDLVEFPPDAH
jgi:hypothetical protein